MKEYRVFFAFLGVILLLCVAAMLSLKNTWDQYAQRCHAAQGEVVGRERLCVDAGGRILQVPYE